MPDETTRVSIGDFARACGLSAKALRLYDEMGLLVPVEVDATTGYRRYSPEQLERARLVARLRLAGMPLGRIQVVADLPARSAAAELTSYWRQVEADTGTAGRLIAALVEELDELDDEENTMSSITTTTTNHPEPGVRIGIGARDSQEDAVRFAGGLYAVADGVGALRGVASAALAALSEPRSGEDPLSVLDAGVAAAARAVGEQYAALPEAASTLTAVVLSPGRATCAHVGDSRLYLVRDGSLTRLTRDHTVVQTLIDEGRLTSEEARTDERRVVLNRAVAAGSPYAPDLAIHATQAADRLVLTTDGVHGRLEPAALSALLLADGTPDEVAASVARAVEDHGADDNYAVLVVDVD